MDNPSPNQASAPHPERKHLRRLDRIFLKWPIFYISTNALDRRPAFRDDRLAQAVIQALTEAGPRHGWKVGRYAVMPDHVHFLCAPAEVLSDLGRFVGGFKEAATKHAWKLGWEGRLWQREFADHLWRTRESYEQKWHYASQNPVAAGLCAKAEDWPYQGEIEIL
jgi:putative transposase